MTGNIPHVAYAQLNKQSNLLLLFLYIFAYLFHSPIPF